MKTVLQYDEANDEYKPKPSKLQLVLLEKAISDPQDQAEDQGSKSKPDLTGKETEMGIILVDLAQYARTNEKSEKLYLPDSKDMYVEIIVQSKPLDPVAQSQQAS